MSNWKKGLVWVNGICLGRYWNIGPTQRMYLAGCWLKKGKHEVMVFDKEINLKNYFYEKYTASHCIDNY